MVTADASWFDNKSKCACRPAGVSNMLSHRRRRRFPFGMMSGAKQPELQLQSTPSRRELIFELLKDLD